MKKVIPCILLLALLVSLTACGGNPATDSEDSVPSAEPETVPEEIDPPEPKKETLDLTGQWKQVNAESEDSYYGAVIGDEKIELHRVSYDGGERDLYWAGSFVPPDTEEGPYSWISQVGERRTDTEAIAAHEGTKAFTYENGQIAYSVVKEGTETTVLLEREEWEPGLGISNVPDELVSGFDPATNQTATFGGITFSFPAYLNTRDERSTDDHALFYTIEPDYHCSIQFFVTNAEDMTQKKFDETKAGYADYILKRTGENITEVESQSTMIAGLSGWTSSFRRQNRDPINSDVQAMVFDSLVFNPQSKQIVRIQGVCSDGDMSGYDYGADFLKILDSAQLAS